MMMMRSDFELGVELLPARKILRNEAADHRQQSNTDSCDRCTPGFPQSPVLREMSLVYDGVQKIWVFPEATIDRPPRGPWNPP